MNKRLLSLGSQLVLASSNPGKLTEFSHIFSGHNISVIPQSEFNISDADETGLSFVENAIIKARHACFHSGLPSLADDSGLEVDALNGAPGIYSARFSGLHATDVANNTLLLKKLADTPTPERTARFQCVLVVMLHANDPTPLIFQGTWEGTILLSASGTNGFGYDPLFFATQQQTASAQLTSDIKNKVSHRGQAVSKLIEFLQH